MPARDCSHVGERRRETGSSLAGPDVLARHSMAFENVRRKVHLPAPGVPWECAQQPRDRVGDAAMPCSVGGAWIVALREDHPCEPDEARRGLAAIALEIVQTRHRIVVEIEKPR